MNLNFYETIAVLAERSHIARRKVTQTRSPLLPDQGVAGIDRASCHVAHRHRETKIDRQRLLHDPLRNVQAALLAFGFFPGDLRFPGIDLDAAIEPNDR